MPIYLWVPGRIGILWVIVVQNTNGDHIGKVLAVVNFGAGDLVEIQLIGTDQTLMLEFTHENVPEINLAEQLIIVDPPAEVSERDT